MFKKSLRKTLIAFVIISITLPLLILGSVTIYISTGKLKEEIQSKNLLMVSVLVNQMEELIDDIINHIKIMRVELKNYKTNHYKIYPYIDNIIKSHQDLLKIIAIDIIDSKGKSSIVSSKSKEYIDYDFSGSSFFKKVIDKGEMVWSTPFLSPRFNKPMTIFAVPMGKGAIFVHLDLSQMGILIDQLHLKGTNHIGIVDRSGMYIAHSQKEKSLKRDIDPNYYTIMGQLSKEPFTGEVMYEDLKMVLTADTIRQTGWSVLVYQSMETIFQPQRNLLLALLVGTALILIGAIILSFIPVRIVIKNVNNFIATSQNIARGKYTIRKDDSLYDEFQELANQMSEMSNTIKIREDDLTQSREKLQATIEALPDLMFEIDYEGTIYSYNTPDNKMLYVPADEFLGKKMFSIIPDEVSSVIIDAMNEANQTGLHRGGRYKLELQDGLHWFELSIALKKSEHLEDKRYILLARDITENKKNEESIINSLKEKDILLAEIHHRVKNNMQIISSLLAMQGDSAKNDDLKALLQESENRIQSMALVHEKLYKANDFSKIDFSEYVKELVSDLYTSLTDKKFNSEISIKVMNIFLKINIAIPCGLILNELITNSFKYAFPENQKGQLTIEFFKKEDSDFTLIVYDNGVGIPEDITMDSPNTLGLRLVKSLVLQLEGEILLNREEGTCFTINFPELS